MRDSTKIAKTPRPSKTLMIILFSLLGLAALTSCEKEEIAMSNIPQGKEPLNITGIAFNKTGLLDADFVTFKARRGTGVATQYGQSLDGFNYNEIQLGGRTIFDVQVFDNGNPVGFKMYILIGKEKKYLESTFLAVIREKEIFNIYLEK